MSGVYDTIFGPVPVEKTYEWQWVEEHFEPLKSLYCKEGVTEIFVNRFDDVSIECLGKLEKTDVKFEDEEALLKFINQLGLALNQQIDADNPILDARLPDCSRLCCTLPEVTPQGCTVTLRIAPKNHITPKELVQSGAMNQAMLDYLKAAVERGHNIIVSGNTGSGKTTLLRALARYIPTNERVAICEDTQELYIDWLPHKISMESPKRERCSIEMKSLIETALRVRPDRIWVGEIRKAAAADAFLQAINTGHSGCATTLHANSAEKALTRLQYLVASQGNISYELAKRQITDNVDLFIHASRTPEHGRKVLEIKKVQENEIVPVFHFDKRTGQHVGG
ncbi:CpaF family protein [Vibrio coralliilyticus]|uniref:CpaF family protein n=1 Tax=Vibrio coralliilyticus TaxID=190893 RepID=UPI000C170AD7|nr:ATPase, T2SS/T4P/T4SS family [Vibrio coralliilyticus]